MPQTRTQIWGTLKRYLAYTAAGFVILGGIGAIESVRPPVVGPAKASESLQDSASAQVLLDSLSDQPGWMQRLRFDLTSPILAAEKAVERQPAATAPYYPAPDTVPDAAWAAEQATVSEPAATPQATSASQTGLADTLTEPTPAESTLAAAPEPEDKSEILAQAQLPASDMPATAPGSPAAAPVKATQSSPGSSATRALVATLNWVYTGVDQPLDTDTALDDASADDTDSGISADAAPNAAAVDSDAGQSLPSDATPDQTDQTAQTAQTAEVPLDSAFQQTNGLAGEQRVIEVQRGDTLFGLLTKAGLTEQEAQAAGHSLADVFSPSDLKAGQQITLNLVAGDDPADADANNGRLIGLKLTPSVERDVKLTRGTDGRFIAASVDKPLKERIDRAVGAIDGSLYESAHDAGLPASLIGEIIKSFSYDVDFQRDIHEGDSFEAMYERFDADNGDLAKVGNLLYASLTLSGKPLAIYYFEHDGDGAYYTADGQAVRKSLLKTPIDGAKITSTFGMRVNPILGYSMMHKGIDFGAPTGTPIFAAGNGTIEYVGRKNGYGNYIKIRHNSTYETAYGHISKFAGDIKRGTKVKQGQVIAYVGATGRATGPHLHFEILINGSQVNPAKVKTVASDRLTGKTLAAFKAQVAVIEAERRHAMQRNEIADRSGNATIDCTSQHGCPN